MAFQAEEKFQSTWPNAASEVSVRAVSSLYTEPVGLAAAGFVAYFINHSLKPQGWAHVEERPQPAA